MQNVNTVGSTGFEFGSGISIFAILIYIHELIHLWEIKNITTSSVI